MLGTVKWFSQEKGYGFITSEEGIDHHFNVQSVQGAQLPSNGDKVSFDPRSGNKGPRAFNICIVEKSSLRNTRHVDDRIDCPGCAKKIVPRLITYRGEPEKSVCPYCATTIKNFSKCFIASAVYGDSSCAEVRTLRNFRDDVMMKNKMGKAFVSIYYKLSPSVAVWLTDKPRASLIMKMGLDRIVRFVANLSDDSKVD